MEMLRKQVNSWLSVCQRNYSEATYKMYHCVIEQLQNHIAQNGQQLTSSSVEDFLDGKYKNGGSRREFNTYLIVTRSFCNWRQRKYEIESPVHKIPFIKEDPPKQRVLSEEEYQLCLKNTRGMDNDIIQFFGNTGLRKSEFANLKWDNINQRLKFICITGKGRKQRIIPLNETCREVLKKYSRLTNNEFVQFCQRYPGTEGASWMCRKIAKKIGIPKFGVHAIRHYFATELIRKGISIYKVSQVLGHSSVITTEQIYIHLMPVDLLGITDVLD